MKCGARCKHCGNYRVFVTDDATGAVVNPLVCTLPNTTCEPETAAERMTRQNAEMAGARATMGGTRKRKIR